MISALVAAIASIEPSSSMWTGPTLVITPTSGSAIAQSSAIWPGPRIPISSTSTSVPSGAARLARGRPISVLKFSGLATTCPGRSARQMSLTVVLPVDPVIPTTRQPSSSRQARASDCSEASGSAAPSTQPEDPSPAPTLRCMASSRPHWVATRIPQAPWRSAAAPNSPPSKRSPGRPTNRSPSRTSRESITTRAGPPGPPLASTSTPAAEARRSPSKAINSRRPRLVCAAPPGPRRGRRTGSSAPPRTPAPARAPCRRSRPCPPAPHGRGPGRSRRGGQAR